MEKQLTLRSAKGDDIESMIDFILLHGPNEWNYLPEDAIGEHIRKISTGEVQAIIAIYDEQIVGFVTFEKSYLYSKYHSSNGKRNGHWYVGEAVVHKDYVCRGIGTMLLKEAVKYMFERELEYVYIDRHEENAASAGMMRKAGFSIIDTFSDREKRTFGSGNTTICRIKHN